MNWDGKRDTAKRLIDKYGADMRLVTATMSTYNAVTDAFTKSTVSYSIKGLLLNSTVRNDVGEYSKSKKVRLLIAAKGLPELVEDAEFTVYQGAFSWKPSQTVPLKPGGTTIIYIIDTM